MTATMANPSIPITIRYCQSLSIIILLRRKFEIDQIDIALELKCLNPYNVLLAT